MRIKYPYEYDTKKRRLARIYTRRRMVNGLVNGLAVPAVFFFAVIATGFHAQLKGAALSLSPALHVPLYVLLLLALLTLVQLPLRFYSGYIFEHRYKLSNQTVRAWAKDAAKSTLLGYAFAVPLLTGLYLLMPLQSWWLYAGIAYFAVMLFISYILPVVVLPLFYKIEPYKDAAQRSRLMKIARKEGIKVSDIVVVRESERSKKANAMFLGLGNTKKIALFDTLTNNFTKDETETVVAHELGHYVNKDILRGAFIDAVKIFPVLIAVNAVLLRSEGILVPFAADISSLPLFMLSFMLIDFATMPVTNAYSRKYEAEADWYALEVVRKPKAQISAEKRLHDMNLADDTLPPAAKFFFATHPTGEERIRMCEDWMKKNRKR